MARDGPVQGHGRRQKGAKYVPFRRPRLASESGAAQPPPGHRISSRGGIQGRLRLARNQLEGTILPYIAEKHAENEIRFFRGHAEPGANSKWDVM